MNIAEFTKADSTQWNGDDLMDGNLIAQIESVQRGKADQPVDVHLKGHTKIWRPCLTLRRVLGALLSMDTERWKGQWVELYLEPTVKFGGKEVGGVRIKAMSAVSQITYVSVNASRARKQQYKVLPLTPPSESPAAPASTGIDFDDLSKLIDLIRQVGDPEIEPKLADRYGSLEQIPANALPAIMAKLEGMLK